MIRKAFAPGREQLLPTGARDDDAADDGKSAGDDGDRRRDFTASCAGARLTAAVLRYKTGNGVQQDETTVITESGAGAVLVLTLRTTHAAPPARRPVFRLKSTPTLAPRGRARNPVEQD
jgi:hypothetical protein